MRKILFVLPLLLTATPAAAQSRAPLQVPPVAIDPATVAQLATAAQAMSDALLDLHVGNLKAAVDGRDPTPAERRMTVRDLARKKDPNFDRDLNRKMAAAGPELMRSIAAINRAMPALQQALDEARESLDRVTANLPDPTYPRR
jgi:hypothetical protein